VTRYPPKGRHCSRCNGYLLFSEFRPNLKLKEQLVSRVFGGEHEAMAGTERRQAAPAAYRSAENVR